MTSTDTVQLYDVEVPAKAAPTIEAMVRDAHFAAEDLRACHLVGPPRTPTLLVLTTTGILVNADSQLGSWTWAEAGPLTLVDGRHPQFSPVGGIAMTFSWNESPDAFAEMYRSLRAEALGMDEWSGAIPMSRVLTIDTFPGLEITGVLGAVSDNATSQAWSHAEKDPAAGLAAATESLRAQAERLGANAIIGLSAVALTPRSGLSALAGDSPGVLLLGTAVRVAPAG